MQHPFELLPADRRGLVFLLLLVLTLIVGGALQFVGPRGIVRFELAGSRAEVSEILESWGEAGQRRAVLNLKIDFLFLLAYSNTIALACIWAATVFQGYRLSSSGAFLAWGQWLAAILDAIENVALLTILLGSSSDIWPRLAQLCAIPKFSLVAVGLLYALGGLIVYIVSRAF